ncbi:hypothetical protein Meth11DRAFT_1390 [Methylophilaceae bacterium 11]|nr:hypothetical protein Meth11DRAFT_1390 [Methylophilaceae bacterium 11]
MKSYMGDLEVRQVNCYYNYTVGLATTEVNLLKTAAKLLKSGTARTVCFSDLKYLYLDDENKVQLEFLHPQGRQWDSGWEVKFSDDLPRSVIEELTLCLELSFHEHRIENPEARQIAPYIRAALPPLILEKGDMTLPIYPWLKLLSDGIMILSFQLDTSWDGLSEADFISDIVNIFQRYFDRVWVHANIQRLDAEQLIPNAFENELSIGGELISGRKSKKLIKEMRLKSRLKLNESLGKKGQEFEIGQETWTLHQIAGSEEQSEWEATIDLCRSIYINAITSLVVTGVGKKSKQLCQVQLWQGRPSISLMRFNDQPSKKEELIEKFGPSLSRVMMRASEVKDPPELPPDLRLFGDYCLHANRTLLLWTWLRPNNSTDDAWEDSITRAMLMENQGRAEYLEYHNMRIARACAIANSPPSDQDLIEAYEVLASADTVIHHSSQAGEITDALSYVLSATGTRALVESGKEQARWHLDERRYRTDKSRAKVDSWLAVVFGLVGVSGVADLVIKPFLGAFYIEVPSGFIGLVSFLSATVIFGMVAFIVWVINTRK